MWGPAGWVFDNVLQRVCSELSDDGLVTNLLNARTEGGSGYCDLRELPANRFRALVAAAEKALRIAEDESPAVFAQPEFHPGFVDRFRDLIVMLRSDARNDPNVPNRNDPNRG